MYKKGLKNSFTMNELVNSTEASKKVFAVGEVTRHIKSLLEGQFPSFWIGGEISNFKAHTSGHFYFSLKDTHSQISAVMFRGDSQGLTFHPRNGEEVEVQGRITVYEPRGNYQIICKRMRQKGQGELQIAFEKLKMKLKEEGLFDMHRKRSLPPFPARVALITSPTGAAVQDMIRVLQRRCPFVEVVLVPTLVQGVEAVAPLCEALDKLETLGVDIAIVGRGGGSMEDLWAFNKEEVVRKVAASSVPIISAVGHEVDFTLTDFAADLRAPTPSVAAELIVQSAQELSHKVQSLHRMLLLYLQKQISLKRNELQQIATRLVNPEARLQQMEQYCDELKARLDRSLQTAWERWQNDLQIQSSMLESLSPLKVLERGYAIVRTSEGKVLRSIQTVAKGDLLKMDLMDGQLDVKVTHKKKSKKETWNYGL